VKNLEALISNCRKRIQEINELKALTDHGTDLNEEEALKVANHAQVYTELQSLEQSSVSTRDIAEIASRSESSVPKRRQRRAQSLHGRTALLPHLGNEANNTSSPLA